MMNFRFCCWKLLTWKGAPMAPVKPFSGPGLARMIQWFVDKYVPVGWSNRRAITMVLLRSHRGRYVTFKGLPRWRRKVIMRMIIKAHQRNRDLFIDVMTGSFHGKRH
jgi:hypothetical protein